MYNIICICMLAIEKFIIIHSLHLLLLLLLKSEFGFAFQPGVPQHPSIPAFEHPSISNSITTWICNEAHWYLMIHVHDWPQKGTHAAELTLAKWTCLIKRWLWEDGRFGFRMSQFVKFGFLTGTILYCCRFFYLVFFILFYLHFDVGNCKYLSETYLLERRRLNGKIFHGNVSMDDGFFQWKFLNKLLGAYEYNCLFSWNREIIVCF